MTYDRHVHIPQPGSAYRHYKGGDYVVLAVGRLSEQRDQLMVVYHSRETEQTWIRPLGMWSELVPWPDLAGSYPRFMPCAEYEVLLAAHKEATKGDPY